MMNFIIIATLRALRFFNFVESFTSDEIFALPKRLRLHRYRGEWFLEYKHTLYIITPQNWRKSHETQRYTQTGEAVKRDLTRG